MKIYYDTNEENIYTDFTKLCEALREDYKEYADDDVSFENWVDSLLDDEIHVYDVPDYMDVVYLDVENGDLYLDFFDFEESVLAKSWENFSEYVDCEYTPTEIYFMSDSQRDEVQEDFMQDSWDKYFEDVYHIYMIDPKREEVKECFKYSDFWD